MRPLTGRRRKEQRHGACKEAWCDSMEINQMRFFVALAETLNFSRAAEICGVSQPGLSKAIKKLEEELGGPLVRREGAKTHLTVLGQRVLPRLTQALSLAELAKSEAKAWSSMAEAKLQLGVMCTIGPAQLISLISHLTTHQPTLEIEIVEGSGSDIVERLVQGEFDVALAGMPDYPDTIRSHPLYDEPYFVAFPAGHRFEAMEAVPLRELDGESYLQRINCEYPDHVAARAGAAGSPLDMMSLNILYKSEHEDWIQAMIIAGLGCACMPEHMQLFPDLRRRPLVEPHVSRTISLLVRRGRRHMPIVERFVQLCGSMAWSNQSSQVA